MTITVYSKPSCVQCNATYRALHKAGVRYEVVDITEDADGPRLRHVPRPRAGPGGRGRRRPLVGLPAGRDQGARRPCLFALTEAPDFEHLVGQDSPVKWVQGSANPIKLLDTATLAPPSAEIEHTTQGNARVRLEGWTLVVYPDGRARVSPPGKSRVLIESAFPGPDGANVTLRAGEG
jgi:hypothetical protein